MISATAFTAGILGAVALLVVAFGYLVRSLVRDAGLTAD